MINYVFIVTTRIKSHIVNNILYYYHLYTLQNYSCIMADVTVDKSFAYFIHHIIIMIASYTMNSRWEKLYWKRRGGLIHNMIEIANCTYTASMTKFFFLKTIFFFVRTENSIQKRLLNTGGIKNVFIHRDHNKLWRNIMLKRT